MARAFYRTETAPSAAAITTRLGAVSTAFPDTEIGKFVKPSGESGYVLCAVGDLIDGYVSSVSSDKGTSAGFVLGSVQRRECKSVTFDGSQAAGTGAIALGDAVVAGTPVAQGTALTIGTVAKVRKATLQPHVTAPAALADVPTHINASQYMWKVISLGTVGTGAVGTIGVIERVGT